MIGNPAIRYLMFSSDSDIPKTIPDIIDLQTADIEIENDLRILSFSEDTGFLSADHQTSSILVRGLDESQDVIAQILIEIDE